MVVKVPSGLASSCPDGKWVVVQPDMHVQDFALRGVAPALLNDWYGRMNVMGWWNQSIERDAMKTLVGKAGSDADAAAMKMPADQNGLLHAWVTLGEVGPNLVLSLDATLISAGKAAQIGEFAAGKTGTVGGAGASPRSSGYISEGIPASRGALSVRQ